MMKGMIAITYSAKHKINYNDWMLNYLNKTDYFNSNKRLYPVGRLDYDTTGLLIVTNDGELANLIMHPKNEIEKVYIAKIEGIIKGAEINKLKTILNIEKNCDRITL